jgi:predicted acetyltransferase
MIRERSAAGASSCEAPGVFKRSGESRDMASTPATPGSDTLAVKLILTAASGRDAFLRMAQEWRDRDVDRYAAALEDFEQYLQQLRHDEAPSQPEGRVPSTQYCLQHRGEIVACVRLRSRLNEALALEGGHIGYDVRPCARGHGFGTMVLQDILPVARELGLDRVLLTADADNLPSLKIIERNGGIFTGEIRSATTGRPMRQYWIALWPSKFTSP